MSTSKPTITRSQLLYLSISFSCVFPLSIIFDFIPGIFLSGILSFFLFFLYPTIPTFLLTFIFLISKEVIVVANAGLALQLPTEPLIVILGGIWFIYALFRSNNSSVKLTIFDYAVVWYLSTVALSVLLSTHKIVSLKFFFNALGYLIVCVYWTKYSISNAKILEQLIIVFFGFAIFIAVFSISKHSFYNFDKLYTNVMTEPFFEERGTYAAYLSIIFGFSFVLSLSDTNNRLKILSIITSTITILAILLSYTRAAWLSCIFIIGLFFLLRAKTLLKNKYFWIFLAAISTLFLFLSSNLLISLQENALTIVDTQRNVSNLERINRWVAAINMFMAKPFFGFGVGTYPIHFYEFQNPFFSTIISDMYAGPHNDYLQYLSEGGLVGFSGWIFLLIAIFKTALKTLKTSKNSTYTSITFGATLAISTYLFHALFNGFLEFDKVAVPFWLCVGIILAINNLQTKKHQE